MIRYKILNKKASNARATAKYFFLLYGLILCFCVNAQSSSVSGFFRNSVEENFGAEAPHATGSHFVKNESPLDGEHASKKHFLTINNPAYENKEIAKILNQGIQEAEKVLNHLPQRKYFSALTQIAFGNANLRSDSFKSRAFKF